MSDRMKQFISQVVSTIVSRVASGDVREARMKFTGDAIRSFEIPIWIEVFRFLPSEAGASEKLHARTNDIDFMVTAAPSFWVTADLNDPDKAVSAITAYLTEELGRHSKVDFFTDGRCSDNKPLKALIGDSETGVEGIRPFVIPDISL